ncbi:MAG: beta-eliminating lyase-related protein [Pseudotabrizicola sp.]|uniref:threonine aldolase family protein n=1 Tax=Pseudotabrizicola sp. TaxID=2939647 RepID=UPI0027198D26|nr:beta-eliminating lyase-related protein [Pseudotabrizicola sp.]MDO9641378.1 beta-eliminating lyase-related protein [Pseudotabrizicola sp.]
MFFASDNGAPVHPAVFAAMERANAGYALSYGNDAATDALRDRIRVVFEAPTAEVLLLTTGTAANALALALLTPPWGTTFCHRHAHIAEDECGAPEFFSGGAKLTLIDGPHGKISPNALEQAIAQTGGSVHVAQRGALSLTNVTEAGTLYTAAELSALTAVAKAHGLPVHLDGARFANALAATGATPAELSWRAGVDVLSLGGTKNGLLAAEALVLFDPAKAWEAELRRKRAGHLNSKLRFVAAQFEAWFSNDLWLTLARHANTMAARLATGLAQVPGAEILHSTPANIIFARLPEAAHARAKAAGAVYYQSDDTLGRLVASWSTTEDDVDALLAAFKS